MKKSTILSLSVASFLVLALVFSLNVKGGIEEQDNGINQRFIELKIEDSAERKASYNVYAINNSAEPKKLMENVNKPNQYFGIEVPESAEYLLIERSKGDNHKRRVFKIEGAKTTASFIE